MYKIFGNCLGILSLVVFFCLVSCSKKDQHLCPVTERDKQLFSERLEQRPFVKITILSIEPSRVYPCGVAIQWRTAVTVLTRSQEGNIVSGFCGHFDMSQDFPRNSFGEIDVATHLSPLWTDMIHELQTYWLMSQPARQPLSPRPMPP
ncbi:hypothetical protein EM20IM_02940 [Candidatus Methylacidiphilum infernorum]|uniref:Lipoprotein n=1 Tax=Candidatus Methylacidiphilum infernorum TaxID=511746 RepID=A0ABX7PWC9_9BACT|nr:hypothetical protein [Candidatus Methylacidiphilum infernorum]QSR87304.1 hypothetical protein EM20IM_02940 [Candidatus Methylacidiphilum infernorum]